MKKAIIIGASSGIGNSLARIMSAEGYVLGITGRRRNLLDELARSLPNQVHVSDFDLADVEISISSLNQLIEDMGGVDIVVINSGYGKQNPEMNWDTQLMTIDVNVRGFSAMANVAFNYFMKKGSGQIIGVSSIIGILGSGRAAAYSASKTYVSSFLDCMRRRVKQLNHKMIITDVIPGFVDTPMTKDNTNMFWVSSSDKAAGQILRAIEKKKNRVYVTRRWAIIGWLMHHLPRSFFYKF